MIDDQLMMLAAEVADHLQNGWRLDRRPIPADDQYYGVCIIGSGKRRLRMFRNRRDCSKLSIIGMCPRYGLGWQEFRAADLPYSTNAINASHTRSPRSIAQDIQRRLLPKYEDLLRECEKNFKEYLDRISKYDSLLNMFRRVTTCIDYGRNPKHEFGRKMYITGRECSGSITLSGFNAEPSCYLDLRRISVDLAIKILSLVEDDKISNST